MADILWNLAEVAIVAVVAAMCGILVGIAAFAPI